MVQEDARQASLGGVSKLGDAEVLESALDRAHLFLGHSCEIYPELGPLLRAAQDIQHSDSRTRTH